MAATPVSGSRTSPRTNRSSTRSGHGDREHSSGRIVATEPRTVKPEDAPSGTARRKPGRPKTRRQSHGSAWHWKQTDGWYFTLPGTKNRVPLFDEDGVRIRGKENKEKARLALARIKLVERGELAGSPLASGDWVVARVCSEYIQYCQRGAAAGTRYPEAAMGSVGR